MAIHDDDRTEAQRLKDLPPDSQFRQEAERLAKLSARERMEALAVHWRIADDGRLSRATRDYARNVAETLELLTALNFPSIKEEVRSGSLPGLPDLPASALAMHGLELLLMNIVDIPAFQRRLVRYSEIFAE